MTKPVVVHASAEQFFSDALHEALDREHVSVSDLAIAYLVLLLASRKACEYHPDDTLGDRFAEALQAKHADAVARLQEVGDRALLVSGLWWRRQYQRGRRSNARYHIQLGRSAYATAGGDPFTEMAAKFEGLVDALVRLGTTHSRATAQDVMRLYRLWQETHSRAAAVALAERGIFVGSQESTTRS